MPTISTQSVQAPQAVESMGVGTPNTPTLTNSAGAASMLLDASDSLSLSTDVVRAELALMALRQRVASHADRQTRLKQFCHDWHENWQHQAEHLQHQVRELEARLAPWMPRDEGPRLGVIRQSDEAA